MHRRDMSKIARKAGIRTPSLEEALRTTYNRCEACAGNWRALISRKALHSLKEIFNESVLVEYCYVSELSEMPILSVTERSSGRSRNQLARSRDMGYISSMFKTPHVLEDGPPEELRADPEFDKDSIKAMCARQSINFRETPPRRHYKIGAAERSHGILEVIVRKFLSQHACNPST